MGRLLLTSSARRITISLMLAGLFAGTFAAPAALAQPAASAQVQYRKAHEAIKAKKWNEARELLIDLWGRAQTYDVAASLGQVEYWLGNYASGARYVTFALQNIPPAEKPEMSEELEAALDELKTKLGTVRVLVSQAGAEVRVDGQVVGTSPLASSVYLDPGPHRFEALMAGARAEASLDAAAGQGYVVDLKLSAEPPATNVGPPPTQDPRAAHEAAPADGAGKKSLIPLYVAGGVAVAALSTGIAFTVVASKTSDRIEALQRQVGEDGCSGRTPPAACRELADEAEKRDSQKNISYASFAVAGAAVLGGAAYLLWPNDPAPRASVGISRLPGGAFVTFRGDL
jgi:hypothetical protein